MKLSYFDKENNYHCTSDQTCPKEYARLINNIQCIKNDINYFNQNIYQEMLMEE